MMTGCGVRDPDELAAREVSNSKINIRPFIRALSKCLLTKSASSATAEQVAATAAAARGGGGGGGGTGNGPSKPNK